MEYVKTVSDCRHDCIPPAFVGSYWTQNHCQVSLQHAQNCCTGSRNKAFLDRVDHRRLSFVGDGMTACGLGLAMGLGLLAATEFLGEETLHDMLTFNPGNFFT